MSINTALKAIEIIPFGCIPDFSPKLVIQSASSNKPEAHIKAYTDKDAIESWLNKYKENRKTLETYQREGERFYLWCIYQQGLTIGQLKKEDFEKYFYFLEKPPDTWCVSRSILREGRQSKKWRPFVSGLKGASFQLAVRVVNSLMNYLVLANYIQFNPIKLIKKYNTFSISQDEKKYQVWQRMLEIDEWQGVQRALEDLPESTSSEIDNKVRTQFLFSLLYFLGLRINEVAENRWSAFRLYGGQWWFFVEGKGQKKSHIPVNHQLLLYAKAYRIHLGLNEMPDIDETEYLFISKLTKKKLSVRRLYELVKIIGIKASKGFPEGSLQRKKLERLSPHWLRHLSASHQDKAGIPTSIIKENHRHQSVQTTQIYIHAEDDKRFDEMQKLSMNIQPSITTFDFVKREFIVEINLTKTSVCWEHNFLRFIDVIERRLFRSCVFKMIGNDGSSLLDVLKRKMKFSRKCNFSYQLKGIDSQKKINLLKSSMIREAEIRLFSCFVEIRENK